MSQGPASTTTVAICTQHGLLRYRLPCPVCARRARRQVSAMFRELHLLAAREAAFTVGTGPMSDTALYRLRKEWRTADLPILVRSAERFIELAPRRRFWPWR